MSLSINGFPKSGNHALQKVLGMFGFPVLVWHRPYSMGLPDGSTNQIFIKRDPRNILISSMRLETPEQSAEATERGIAEKLAFKAGNYLAPNTIIDQMAEYTPWLSDPNTFVVKYEDLILNDAEIKRLCVYLGVPYIMGSFEALPGDDPVLEKTWNNKHADYKLVWNASIEKDWNDRGGNKLLTDWGYPLWQFA